MPIDPNIALGFRGVQAPDPLAQYGTVAQIQGVQQANALRALQTRELEEGVARRNRLAAQLGAPEFAALTPEQQVNALTRGGFLTEARSLAESQSKVGKEQREAEKSKFDLVVAQRKFGEDLKRGLSANPSDENIIAFGQDAILQGLYTPAQVDATVKQLLALPTAERVRILSQAGATASELKPTVSVAPTGIVQSPAFGGAATVVPGTAEAFQMTPAQKAQAQRDEQRIKLEAQRVGLEGQRVALAQEEARLKREGIEGIAPKELQKRNAALPQAKASVESFESKTDQFIKELENLRDDPGLDQITGSIYGRTPSVSREGSRAQALYNKIFAKGGFQALQDLREASKTGGALGNVSNQEGERLERSIVGGLDRTQNIADVKQGINDLIENLKVSKARVRNTFDETYSYRNPQQTKALTPADQQALDWANANPKDPRAAQIKQRLGL